MKHRITAGWMVLLAAGTAAPAPQNEPAPAQKLPPFLTFQDGKAEEAIKFYVSLFKNSRSTP